MPIKKEKLDAIKGYREYQARKEKEKEEQTKGSSPSKNTSTGSTEKQTTQTTVSTQKKAAVKKEKLDAIQGYREWQENRAEKEAATTSKNRVSDSRRSRDGYVSKNTTRTQKYDRPVYTRETAERMAESVKNAETALTKKLASGVDITTEVERRSKSIENQVKSLKNLEGIFNRNPSEANAQKYNAAYEQYVKDVEDYNNLYNEYKALYDAYNTAYDDYTNYMDTAKSDASFLDVAGNAIGKGITGAGHAFASTLDFLLPTEFLGKYDYPSKWNEGTKAEYEDYSNRLAESLYGKGKVAETAAEIGASTVQAAPNAILALLSGFTSVGAQGAAAIGTAANTGLATTISTGIKTMAKNPMYWSSFAQTLGTDYEENIENGASTIEAVASAIISSALNAGVEIGGGIETLPDAVRNGGKSAVREWVKSMLDEGKEEVIQDIVSGITQKSMYDQDKTWFSTTDENAVVNPVVLAKDFGMGAAVGGILGGAQTGVVSGMNALTDYANKRIAQTNAQQTAQPAKPIQQEVTEEKSYTLEDAARDAVAAREAQAQEVTKEQTAEKAKTTQNSVQRPTLTTFQQQVKKATGYGEYGVKAISDLMESENMPLSQLRTRFQTAYEAGMTNMPRAKVNLTTDIQQIAFNAGKQDYIMSQKRDVEKSNYATVYGKDSGFIQTDASKGVQQSTIDMLHEVSKDLGIKTRYEEAIVLEDGSEANGSMSNDGIFSISRTSEHPEYVLVAHEGLHRMQQLAPEAYYAFRDFAVQTSQWYEGRLESGVVSGSEVEGLQLKYQQHGMTLQTDEAMDEIAAQFAEKLFSSDEDVLNTIREGVKDVDTRNALQKFFDIVKDLARKLKETVSRLKNKGKTEEAAQVQDVVDNLEHARKLWNDAYQASKVAAQEKTRQEGQTASSAHQDTKAAASVKGDGFKTMFKLKDSESDSVKEQLRSHISELNAMDTVANVTVPTSFGKMMADARKWIANQLKSTGYQVDRQGFGVIVFDEKRLNTSLNYMNSKAEIAAYAVLPRVLKRGIEVGRHSDHKGRAYGTVTFAAPVVLNGKRGNMAAVVKMTNQNSYKIHRILMPDGTAYELEETKNAEPTPARGVTKTGSLATPISSADARVTQRSNNVKRQSSLDGTASEDFYDSTEKYSLKVTDKDTLDFLDNQDTITTYKTMQMVDGKLYPPMASRIDGKFEDYSELGKWEQATEHPELIRNGNKFKLDKGKGQGSLEAAYNPYMHSSNLVINDQFTGAYTRNNLVTVECEVPVSEMTSGYHAQYAKDSVGWHSWHTGTVAGQIRKAKGVERQVFLSRWIKPVRIVPDAEVASMYKELLDGTNVEVPDNVVTPSLLAELKKAGVKIKESGRLKYSLKDREYMAAVKSGRWDVQERLVAEAAKAAGYNSPKLYHGTNNFGFTEFRMGPGDYIFATSSKQLAETYSEGKGVKEIASGAKGNAMYALYGKLGKSLTVDAKNGKWHSLTAPKALSSYLKDGTYKTDDIAWAAKKAGYDSIVFKNLRDPGGGTNFTGAGDVYIFFDKNAVKSADMVTRDNNGDVIPLSKRFSTNNNDIRFSLKRVEADTVTNKAGDVVAEYRPDGSAQFSLKTYREDGRANLKSWLDKRVASNAISQVDADDIVRQLDDFYDICQKFTGKYAPFSAWSNAEVVRGANGKPVFSVVKANGEYAMNLDFSLVCKKRRTLDAVFGEMINRGVLDNLELGEEQIASINQIIRDSGFETACALCFVDSKRYRQSKVADNFVTQYNDMVKMLIPEGKGIEAHYFDFLDRGMKGQGRALDQVSDKELGKGILKLKQVMQENKKGTVPYKIAWHLLNNPQDRKLLTRSEFMNTDGFEALNVKNKKVLGLYNSSKGSGGPKASLSDVQYLGDVLKKNNFTPAKAYAVGGVRIQSFSDYIPRLVFDYLQMTADLTAKKLPAHAYTKEEMFAKQFGMTGIKINMSLVPAVVKDGIAPGLDADGNYVWYDGQSFGSDVNVKGSGQAGFKMAVEIQNAAGYSANCGTIAVGISDEHIWKMLDDPDIRMIIPYHKSSLNHIVAVMNNIDKYNDYTGVQNTRDAKTGIKITGKDFNYNEALRRLGDAKAAADEYLAWCEENDYLPKFDTFAEHENYYKLLEDFSTYDNGEATPQGAVTMTFPKDGDAFGSMSDLIERGLEEDAILEGRRQEDVPGIVDKIEAAFKTKGDAKFSLKDQNKLMKENAQLKETVEGLREQFKTTKFAQVDKKSLDRFTKQLLKDYQSGAEINDTRDALNDLYTYLANGENGETPIWNEAYSRAYDVAVSILENASTLDDEMYREYADLRKYLRTVGMTLDRQYSHDLYGYENLNDFRKAYMGRIKLVNDGLPVDSAYQELAARYPEFFDETRDMNQADMLTTIAETLDKMQPVEVNPYSYNMREAATWLANDIMERFYELPQAKPTFADKAETKLTKQVIKDAKKLERVREQKNERIKDIIEKNREKVKTVRSEERVKREEAVQAVKEHYKAKEVRGSENRRAREIRAKIIRHVGDMSEKLLKPTDKQHIPESLRGPVASMLEAINLESQYTIDQETGKRTKSDDGMPTKRTTAFLALKEEYARIAAAQDGDMVIDPSLLGSDAEGIRGSFDAVIAMRDIRLADMNVEQLNTVWSVIRAVEHSISTAGKMLSSEKYARTVDWADAFVEDTGTRRAKKSLTKNHAMIDMETPYTFFSHYGEAGHAVYRMLRDAQDQQQVMVNKVAEEVSKIVDSKTVKALEKKTHTFTTERGEKLTLTTAHIMELRELMKREQAQDHLMKGGIVQPEIKSARIRRGTDAILLTAGDLANITKTLTPEQVKIADDLQALTTGLLADYGNEASMKAYGYKKFTGTDYWPIKSAREAVHSNIEKGGNNTRSIKNIGMAKSVMPHANNPLDIAGIFSTFSNHAADMTDYAAWLCPMEDANRLYNFKFKDEAGQQTGKTVKGLLDRVGGAGSQKYWHNLMEDIQNGINAPGDSAMWDIVGKSIGNFKGAAVGANLRVVIQQPTAFFRANAVLSPADLSRGLVSGVTKGSGWKKALQYSPIAMRKNVGGFDISNPYQMNEILFDSRTGVRKLNDALAAPAGAADAVTWGRLWNACEWAVAREQKDLEKGSSEFYSAVNQKFTEVIDQTQVVDGVLQRSQIMRSSNAVVKQATSFMGEPIMSYNLMLRAYDQVRYEQNPKRRGKALKVLGRAATALVVTNVVNALAQSVIDGLRDDDEDKEYWDRFWSAFTGLEGDEESAWDKAVAAVLNGNVGSNMNPLDQIPFVKDALSLFQGYDVNRTELEIMADLIDAGQTVADSIDGTGKKTRAYAIKELFAAGAKAFGIPASNLAREVWSIARSIAVGTNNIPVQYEMEKAIYNLTNDSNKARYYDIMFRALVQGDMASYQRIRDDLMNQMGLDGVTIDNAMKSRYKKAQAATPGFALSQDVLDRIGTRDREATKNDEDRFSDKDLNAAQYQQYSTQRANDYRDIMDDLQQYSSYRSMDAEGRNALEAAAWSYAKETALEDASGGQYKTDTKWIDSAQDADDIGLTVAEYIMLKEQYSDTALRSDGVYDAYDAGIPVDVYLEAHDAMGDIKADKDANGNSISGSRKEKIIDYLNALGLTYEQYLYLLGTEYDTVKKTQDYISFFGSQK